MFALIKPWRIGLDYYLGRVDWRVKLWRQAVVSVIAIAVLASIFPRSGGSTINAPGAGEPIAELDQSPEVGSDPQVPVIMNIADTPGAPTGEVLSGKEVTERRRAQVNDGRKADAPGGTDSLASRESGGTGGWMWPVRGTVSSPFGFRQGEMHTGVDLTGDSGSPVKAAREGMVIFTGWRGNYGQQVVIDHGDGIFTSYSHLSGYRVKKGTRVSRGDVVGLIGTTGRSTGAHLHFEVLVQGKPQNPMNYLGTGR